MSRIHTEIFHVVIFKNIFLFLPLRVVYVSDFILPQYLLQNPLHFFQHMNLRKYLSVQVRKSLAHFLIAFTLKRIPNKINDAYISVEDKERRLSFLPFRKCKCSSPCIQWINGMNFFKIIWDECFNPTHFYGFCMTVNIKVTVISSP